MKDKGITKIGVIASNDGFGEAGKGQLAKLAPEYGITIAISEAYDKEATDLTGVLTKLKGQDVQAVVNWSIVPAQSLVAKNMKQIGLDVPLFQSHGLRQHQVRAGRRGGRQRHDLPLRAAAGRGRACRDEHPQKAVLMAEYKKDYEARYKEDVSTFGGHAYDALLILAEAIKKAGSTDSRRSATPSKSLKGVVGTAGIFNFSPRTTTA